MRDAERRPTPAPGEAGDGELLSESDAIASSRPLGGQGGSASGGWGTGSESSSSGGSGDATDDTSAPGSDGPSDWLRDAPSGGSGRG